MLSETLNVNIDILSDIQCNAVIVDLRVCLQHLSGVFQGHPEYTSF